MVIKVRKLPGATLSLGQLLCWNDWNDHVYECGDDEATLRLPLPTNIPGLQSSESTEATLRLPLLTSIPGLQSSEATEATFMLPFVHYHSWITEP